MAQVNGRVGTFLLATIGAFTGCKSDPGVTSDAAQDAAIDASDPDAAAPDAGPAPEYYDVIVVGAGAGGFGAAIQAARLGRSVLVIESSKHIGGQMLTVTAMDESGPDRGEGIYAELTQRIIARYAQLYNGKPVHTCGWNDASMCFEPSDGEAVMRAMLTEAGVRVETGLDVASVRFAAPNEVSGVNTSDHRAWSSKIVIDGTEYGDVLPLAGAAYRLGNKVREAGAPAPTGSGCVQESTGTLTIKSYPGGLPPELDLRGGGAPGADYETFAPYWRIHLTNVPVPDCANYGHWTWACHNAYRGTPDRDGANYVSTQMVHTKTMINALNDYPTVLSIPDQGLPIAAVEDPVERRRTECGARLLTLQFLYYAQAELGQSWGAADEMSSYGLNNDHCDVIGPALVGSEKLFPVRAYIREARRVIGVRTVTGSDILRTAPSQFGGFAVAAQRSFATAVSMGYYPNDLHGCKSQATLEADLGDTPALILGAAYGPYQLPFGAFIPRDVDGLLVVEKNLSMSRLVNSAVRLQPTSMMTGMAAGTIAAIAIQRGTRARDVPPVLVQNALMSSATPPNLSMFAFTDVLRSEPRWGDVQLATTHGVLGSVGSFVFGIAQPLTRGQAAVMLQRAFRYPLAPASGITYSDVPTSHSMWSFIQAMTRQGLTTGCGMDSNNQPIFCPDTPATRGQLAVWIVTTLGLPHPACSAPPFADVPTTDPLCSFVAALKDAGLAVNCASGYCTGTAVTRGDTATFVRRALVYMASNPTTVGTCHRAPPDYCDP